MKKNENISKSKEMKAVLQFSNVPLRHLSNTRENVRFVAYNTKLNILRKRWIECQDSNSEGAWCRY